MHYASEKALSSPEQLICCGLAVEEREHDWWNGSGIKLRPEIGAGEESLHECYNVIYIYLSVLVCVKEWGISKYCNSIDPSRIAYGC